MKSGNWIDELARTLGQEVSRRGTLRRAGKTFAAALLASALPTSAPVRAAGGSCSIRQTADGIVLQLALAMTFDDKRLALSQRLTRDFARAGEVIVTTEIRLDRARVIQIETSSADGIAKVHLLYGDAFRGVNESTIYNDGRMVRGKIDGRAIIPISVAQARDDPSSIQFQDGNPPPVVRVNRDLARAMRDLLEKTSHRANACSQPQSASGSVTTAGTSTLCDDAAFSCLGCYGLCDAALLGCLGGCSVTLWFYAVCAAFCVYEHQDSCIPKCDEGVCCPVNCGDNPPSSCCCEGETCCGGECCPKGKVCKEGVCCEEGGEPCGSTCCAPDQTCDPNGRTCCPKGTVACHTSSSWVCCPEGDACTENICCTSGHKVCTGRCCPNEKDVCKSVDGEEKELCCPEDHEVCDGRCCPHATDICWRADQEDKLVCCPKGQVCGQVCCDELSKCIDEAHSTCCSFTATVCGGACCDSGDVCIGDVCCPGGQACGTTCCPANNYCANKDAGKCKPCDRGEFPCPISIKGAPSCCATGTTCCGNGTCCKNGLPCCDTASGPKCDTSCIPK